MLKPGAGDPGGMLQDCLPSSFPHQPQSQLHLQEVSGVFFGPESEDAIELVPRTSSL